MEYRDHFKLFNPFNCFVPDYPFRDLPSILYRCKKLLQGRTVDQITDVALNIDWAINEYFLEIKENEIARLESEFEPSDDEREDFFVWDGGTRANGKFIFNDLKEDELEIATIQNTRLLDALMESIIYWDDMGGNSVPNFKKYESFAILSMWLLVDTLRYLNYNFVKNIDIIVANTKRDNKDYKDFYTRLCQLERNIYSKNIENSANFAIEAMEAVCYAEHLFLLEKEVTKVKEINKIELQVEEKKRRSMVSEKLNIARHQKRNEVMFSVTDEWLKKPNLFISADKAGIEFSRRLSEKGIDYEPRTIAGWIRACAKKNNISFR